MVRIINKFNLSSYLVIKTMSHTKLNSTKQTDNVRRADGAQGLSQNSTAREVNCAGKRQKDTDNMVFSSALSGDDLTTVLVNFHSVAAYNNCKTRHTPAYCKCREKRNPLS